MLDDLIAGRHAIPISVLTGFLGSGKTTLLNKLLQLPDLRDTAVLVNEFGEVGIDHMLVSEITENIVLLESGCLCCTVRGDLVDALRDLFMKLLRGEIPPFSRIAVETTGLADPAPIVHTLLTDATLRERFRLVGVTATIDAQHGESQLGTHEETVRQTAIADRLVLTKLDLVPPDRAAALRARLERLNPQAEIITSEEAIRSTDTLFFDGTTPERHAEVARRLEEASHDHDHDHHDHGHSHDGHIERHGYDSLCLTAETALDWDRLTAWLQDLLTRHGPDVLRMKGVLDVAGQVAPVVIQGVQHIFYPTTFLPGWNGLERRSQIVLIVRGLDKEELARSFQTQVIGCQPAASPA